MAQPDETIAKVGLGVDLAGGQEVLNIMRGIREQYEAIIRLTGRQTSTGAAQDFERQRKQLGAITDSDVREEVRRIQRRNDLRQRANAELQRMEEQNLARLRRIEAEKQRILEQSFDYQEKIRRERLSRLNTPEYRQSVAGDISARAGGATGNYASEVNRLRQSAASLQAGRNDPAAINDPTTLRYRQDTAREIRAYREARKREVDEKIRIDREEQSRLRREHQIIINDANDRAQGEAATLEAKRTAAIRNRQAAATQRARLRNEYQLEQADLEEGFFASGTGYRTNYPVGSAGIIGAGARSGTPPPPPRGGGPRPPRQPRQPNFAQSGGLNTRGFFTSLDAAGRITRNILIYEVINRATYGLANYVREAINAAQASVDLGNAIEFESNKIGASIDKNRELIAQGSQLGYSRQESRQVVAQALRFTESAKTPVGQVGQFVQTVQNIAASRGQGLEETGRLIDELRQGRPRLVEEYLQAKPEDIFKRYAAQQLNARTTTRTGTPNLFIEQDKTKIKSLNDEITTYVEKMSDAEKQTVLYNFILEQSGRYAGAAAERANTLAGRIDKVNAAFADGKEVAGLFVTELKPVSDLIDYIAGKSGLINSFRPPELRRSGSGNLVTPSDIFDFQSQAGYGQRARAIASVNENAGPLAGIAAFIGGTALLGRGKANEAAKLAEYYKQLEVSTSRFGNDLGAAVNEATNLANGRRAGLIRSSFAGVQRVTYGLTQSVADTLYGPNAIGQGRQLPFNVPAGQTLAQYQAARAGGPQYAAPTGLQIGAGIAGGLIGATVGASVGNIIAQKIDAGPITAAGLTILGGVGGNIIGTAVGDVIGASIAGAIAAKGGLGAIASGGASAAGGVFGTIAGGSTIAGSLTAAVLVPLAVATYVGTNAYKSAVDAGLRTIVAGEQATQTQAKAQAEAAQTGRLRYVTIGPNGLQSLTPSEYQASQNKNFQRLDRNVSFQTPNDFSPSGLIARAVQSLFGGTPSATTSRFIDTNATPEVLQRSELFNTRGSIAQLQADAASRIGGAGTIEDATKQIRDLQEEITKLNSDPKTNEIQITADTKKITQLSDAITDLTDSSEAARNFSLFGTNDPGMIKIIQEARTNFANSDQERKQQEDKQRQERINEQSNALGRLRDIQQGSFRIVGDVATSITGEDNPYTKVLSDQITLAERMQQQWGSLGKAAVDYFTKVEGRNIQRQLTRLDYNTYERSTGIRGQAERERALREGPGISTREQNYLDIQSAIVDRAVQLPLLWRQVAQIAGVQINPIKELVTRISTLQAATGLGGVSSSIVSAGIITGRGVGPNGSTGLLTGTPNYYGGRIEGFSYGEQQSTVMGPDGKPISFTLDAGRRNDYAAYAEKQAQLANLSPEARNQLNQTYAESALGILNEYTPQQIRQAGLGGTYRQALSIKAGGLDFRVQEAQRKAEFQAQEDDRLQKQLRADADFRQRQIAAGANPLDVGRESDRLLLARTEGINPKDLTSAQFQQRQEAQRRDAERVEQDRADAKAAVDTGIEQQATILATVADIRDAILQGNMKMLIQVQNDTQARVDQSELQEANSGKYNIPLDQGEVKTNPYSGSLARYGRGGRKR